MFTALIQTRTSSKRLRSKVILKILNTFIFIIVYKRVLRSKYISKAIILTSKSKSDDIIEKICKSNKIPYFRGSLNNVLKRYYDCAKYYKLNDVVRITSDCPLIDPKIISKICKKYKQYKYNYVSNIIKSTFPDGLDVEIFSFKLLKNTFKNCKSYLEKEHVTLNMLRNKKVSKYNIKYKKNLSNYRFTLDTYDDFIKIKEVFNKYKSIYKPDLNELIKLIKKNKKKFFFKRLSY